MSEERPKPPNAGKGRVKGVPNKVTADARAAFGRLLDLSLPRMQRWIDRVAAEDPAKALDTVLKLAEFCIPRLGRIEHTGYVQHTIAKELTDDELQRIASGGGDRTADEAQRESDPSGVH